MERHSDQIGKLLSDESFLRWLSGEISERESQRWESWAGQNVENQRLVDEARLLWRTRLYAPSPLPDISGQLAKLEHAIEEESPAGKKTARSRPDWWPNFRSFRLPVRVRLAVGVAAIAVLLFMLYQAPPVQEWLRYRTISTAYGEQKSISLPDGSKVILNANSSLRFMNNWDDVAERDCFLRGEAYFEVRSLANKNRAEFTVYTRDGRVSVVGTRFTVRDRGAGSRVTVEEGLVKITAVDSTGKILVHEATTILKPGQYVAFKKGDRYLKPLQAPSGPYIAWWGDHLVLREAPFREIIERLEETYGLTFRVDDPALLDHTISGSIKNADMEIVLLTLAEALQVQVVREKGIVIFKKPPRL